MSRGFFIIYDDLNAISGVNRKIKSQIQSFLRNGIEISPKQISSMENFPGYKLLYRLPFTNLSPVWKLTEDFRDIDFVYMRRPFFCNFWFLAFLRKLKKMNPRIKVIYEIPTYPYDMEIRKRIANYPVYLKERLARTQLHRYIDRIAILSGEEEVFSIKTLQMSNGYDFDAQKLRNIRRDSTDIHIAAVALFETWHGYERLIKGLGAYYAQGGSRRIILHFAGDGPELKTYKQLAQEYHVSDSCVFYGLCNQEQLNAIYDQCDIAATSLGMFKKKVTLSRELKSREYLAKGLPILCSGKLDLLDIEELRPYLLSFPNDESLVDFNAVSAFCDCLYSGKSHDEKLSMCQSIRDIARANFNMDIAMKNVISYIRGESV